MTTHMTETVRPQRVTSWLGRLAGVTLVGTLASMVGCTAEAEPLQEAELSSVISPTQNSYYFNWYTGGARGAEQGTHGIGMGDCPLGQVVVGIQYFEGGNSDWVDGVGVHCRVPNSADESFFNWYTGGARDAEQGTHGIGMGDCLPGYVVAGIQYFEGGNSDWVDGIGVHCTQPIFLGGHTYSNWYTDGVRGAEQGTHGIGMGDCPAGQVVVGIQYFEGGNSDWVDGFGVHCERWSGP